MMRTTVHRTAAALVAFGVVSIGGVVSAGTSSTTTTSTPTTSTPTTVVAPDDTDPPDEPTRGRGPGSATARFDRTGTEMILTADGWSRECESVTFSWWSDDGPENLTIELEGGFGRVRVPAPSRDEIVFSVGWSGGCVGRDIGSDLEVVLVRPPTTTITTTPSTQRVAGPSVAAEAEPAQDRLPPTGRSGSTRAMALSWLVLVAGGALVAVARRGDTRQ